MWNLLAAGLTALLIFGAGLFLLVRPEKIQKFYLDFYARHAAMAYQDPLSGWLKTRSYILCFRPPASSSSWSHRSR